MHGRIASLRVDRVDPVGLTPLRPRDGVRRAFVGAALGLGTPYASTQYFSGRHERSIPFAIVCNCMVDVPS